MTPPSGHGETTSWSVVHDRFAAARYRRGQLPLQEKSLASPFKPLIAGKRLALSFISVAELFKWTLKRQWGSRKTTQLEASLQRYLIIPYDRDLAWARVVATCEAAGSAVAPSDAWVAAAALRHDLALATNNVKHFEAVESLCGLKVVRP